MRPEDKNFTLPFQENRKISIFIANKKIHQTVSHRLKNHLHYFLLKIRKLPSFRSRNSQTWNSELQRFIDIILDLSFYKQMQQLFASPKNIYFALGAAEKTSLCTRYCRENNFIHFKDPELSALKESVQRHAIIEGSLDLFKEVEKIQPNLHVIMFGKPNNDEEKRICRDYLQIGRCHRVSPNSYEEFRKVFYPNLIFFFGPDQNQCYLASTTLASVIGYSCVPVSPNANDLILYLDKAENYVVNGFFMDPTQLKILEEHFEIRVIHFKYNRIDLPNVGQYFDQEFKLLAALKDKPYYIPVNGKDDPVKIMDDVGEGLCPKLLFVQCHTLEDRKYIQDYVDQTDGLVLSIPEIQSINKRKNVPISLESAQKVIRLTTIFYRDLCRKEIILTDFPFTLNEFIQLENANRKISCYIDLSNPDQYRFEKSHTPATYFLETGRWIKPNKNNSLASELSEKVDYWIVSGAIGSGKTTVAKYLQSEFGFKMIEFETELAAAKEKLANPDQGQEVPLKKILNYFKNILVQNKGTTCIIDGLTYEKDDLRQWIEVVGVPSVINLEVEQLQQIKRTRKKAEGDLAAEVNEQETTKAKESSQKNQEWIEKVCEVAPSAKVFKVDYNAPQILSENNINNIMKPRVFLVQRNNTIVYQNLALKHDMGFISLNKMRLRECLEYKNKCKKRDIIICNHGHEKKRLISEDLYWIEKNIGEIRYIGIWNPEEKSAVDQKLELEKPPEPQKPKPAEGEGEQKPPEDPPAEGEGEGEQKKGFDIYAYEWTKPVCPKNLSQWFFKLKTNVIQFQNSPSDCYKNFCKVLDKLNEKSDCCIYETIK